MTPPAALTPSIMRVAAVEAIDSAVNLMITAAGVGAA